MKRCSRWRTIGVETALSINKCIIVVVCKDSALFYLNNMIWTTPHSTCQRPVCLTHQAQINLVMFSDHLTSLFTPKLIFYFNDFAFVLVNKFKMQILFFYGWILLSCIKITSSQKNLIWK